MKDFYIHLAHILIFSTLLGFIGIKQTNMPAIMFPIVFWLGCVVIFYHIYKSIFKKDAWINYIHIFLIGPLLVYIGFQKEETPRKVFEIVLMIAFASLGYHGYYLINDK